MELDQDGSGDELRLIKSDVLVGDYVVKNVFDIGEDDTVIDIGAHVGRFSMYAAKKAANGVVYAFEPDPRNFQKLERNAFINDFKNVQCEQKAVNETGENVSLHLSNNPSENSLFKNKMTNIGSVDVEAITLVNLFNAKNIKKCNFLKLDCEGSEYGILSSLPKEYFKKIDKIALEYHDNLVENKSLKDLILLFSYNGFMIYQLKRGAWYTGILLSKKISLPILRPFAIFYNIFYVYVVNLILFIATLVVKKIKK